MAKSRLFGSRSPFAPHLLTRGLGKEVADLRADVEAAFLQLETQQAGYLAQAAWFISAASGSDTNDGSAAHPVATFGEIKRRWGGGVIRVAVTITQIGDLAVGDQYDFSLVSTGAAGSVTVTGTLTVASTLPALTAVTNIDITQANDCAQYAAITGHAWAGEIDKMVRGAVGSSIAGAVAFADQDMTAGRCRFSPFMLNPGFNGANLSPIVGDVLEVLTLPKAHNLLLSSTNASVTFKFLDFDDADGNGQRIFVPGNGTTQFSGCILRGTTRIQGNANFYGCQTMGAVLGKPTGSATVCGGHHIGGAGSFQCVATVDNHALFTRGTNLRIFGTPQALPSIGLAGFYGVGGVGAVVLSQGALVVFGNSISGSACIYGDAAYNVEVRGCATMLYSGTEANIFKVNAATAKYLQGATQRASLPQARDVNGNELIAFV
jgi:hypothetical protein